jgi:hypothetical protein
MEPDMRHLDGPHICTAAGVKHSCKRELFADPLLLQSSEQATSLLLIGVLVHPRPHVFPASAVFCVGLCCWVGSLRVPRSPA